MHVKRTSIITGKSRTLSIDVSLEQIRDWERGCLIQDVMSHLSIDEREFIMTGITPEEWDTNLTEKEAPEDSSYHRLSSDP
jgi:hypothetical protein